MATLTEYTGAISRDTVFGPTDKNKVYYTGTDGKPYFIGENMDVTLPTPTLATVDFSVAGGAVSMPTGRFEAMEASFSGNKLHGNTLKALRSGLRELEVRWTQPILNPKKGSAYERVICKAFVKGYVKTLPSASPALDAAPAYGFTMSVTGYTLYINGEEAFAIDVLKNVYRVKGKSQIVEGELI